MHYILGGNKVAAPAATKKEPAGAGARPPTASGGSRPSTLNTGAKRPGAADTAKLEAKVAELETNNGILDREREFYFTKLQQVEQALKNSGLEQSSIGEGLLAILYASE